MVIASFQGAGVRYPLAGMLAVAVCAVLAAARSFTAIGEWAGDVDTEQLNRLGLDKSIAVIPAALLGP